MTKEILVKNLEELPLAAKEFIDFVGQKKLFSFRGKMGAGKTTFIKALCNELEVEDNVCSPTFAICNVYFSPRVGEVYHFDFYRITKTSEALDIGFYDYVDSGCLCIMEWPENVEEILPEETLKVYIRVNQDNSRTVYWED